MKNILKKIIIPVLGSKLISNIGNYIFKGHVPVFMLHRISHDSTSYSGISPDYLKRCLQYLIDRDYHFVSLSDVVDAHINKTPLPPKSIAFTMDDGYWDQAEIAAKIFLEYKCPVTIFTISGMLDNKLWPWDDKVCYLINNSPRKTLNISLSGKNISVPIGTVKEKSTARRLIRNRFKAKSAANIDQDITDLAHACGVDLPDECPDEYRPMSWDIARKLEKQGVDFCPHTVSHRILSRLDKTSSYEEITLSWKRLTEELIRPRNIFCYPTGGFFDYGPREVDTLTDAGFIGAVSTVPGTVDLNNRRHNYIYNLPRYTLPGDFNDFIQTCSWIENIKNIIRYSR